MIRRLILTLALPLALAAHTTTLGQMKPIVFEVRDNEKVEAESGQITVPERRETNRARLISCAPLPTSSRSTHQHLVVANAAHGIMGYPELNPLMLAFLRGERITQLRASFPKWDLKHPAQR